MKKYIKNVIRIIFAVMVFITLKVEAVSVGTPEIVATLKSYDEQYGYVYDIGIDFETWFLPPQEEGEIPYALIDGWELYEIINGDYKLVYSADSYKCEDGNCNNDQEIDQPYSIKIDFVKARTFVVRNFVYESNFTKTYSGYSDEIVLDHRTPNTVMMRVHNGKGCYSIIGEGLNETVCGERNHDEVGGEKVGERTFTLPRGSEITVKAMPEEGFSFDGWYGYDPAGGKNSTSIILMSDSPEYTLTVDNITEEEILTVGPAFIENYKAQYKVIEGADQTYTIDNNNEARFRIDADYSLFEDGGIVFVDEEEVDPSNYTSTSGSTIITLKKEYVDTLSEGEHTLTVLFNDDNNTTTTFNVVKNNEYQPIPNTGIEKNKKYDYILFTILLLSNLIEVQLLKKRLMNKRDS